MQNGWANNGNSYKKGFSNFLGIGNNKKKKAAAMFECSTSCASCLSQFMCDPTSTSTPATTTSASTCSAPLDTFNSSICSLIKPTNFVCYTCTTGGVSNAGKTTTGGVISSPAAQAQAAANAAAAGTKAVSNTLMFATLGAATIVIAGIIYLIRKRKAGGKSK